MVAATVVVVGSQRQAAQAAVCVDSLADEVSAVAEARRCGKRVLVSGATDETSQTFANADGTFTWESSVRSRFARSADGSWVTADATLVANADGTVSPKAATISMVFSGGGATVPLVTATRDGKSLSLSWKGSLPKPALAGNVATYVEVMPGVDLRVIADVDGFSEHLVIKTPQASAHVALRPLHLGVEGKGVTVRRDATGGMSAVDADGEVVFSAGTPLMWDSSDGPARARLLAEGDAEAAADVRPKSKPVGLAVNNGNLVLTPDAVMLADESLTYPVIIDPTVSGAKNHWTELSKSDPTISYFDVTDGTFSSTDSTNGLTRVGLSDWQTPVYTMRPVFEMNTSAVAGKGKVTAASFRLAQRWSGVKCTDTPGPSAVGLYWTPSITSTTNWNTSWNSTGSGWTNRIGTNSEAHRTDITGTCGPADVTYDLTGSIAAMGLGCCNTLTLGLKGENETAHTSWKRYLNNATNSPTMSITYNAKPVISATATNPVTSCVTGTGRPVLATLVPTLSATATDPEAGNLSATFEWWAVGGASAIGTATVSSFASGGTASVQIPTGQLAGVGNYQWWVTISDGATPVSSSWCEFSTMVLDPPAAGCPATLTPGDFNGDGVADRVIGDPLVMVNSQSAAGAIHLIDGVTGAVRTLQQGVDGVPDTVEANDRFGQTLAVFDANRDGCDDLAIGSPYEDNGTTVDAGAVYLLFGSPSGLGKGPSALTILQGAALPNGRGTVPDAPESNDWFGFSLAGGVTSAGEPFLVIGAPGEDSDAGTVHYLRGTVNIKFDGQSPQGSELDDREGFSVAASPYQFAIGIPGEQQGTNTQQAGAACVLNHNSGATAPTGIRCLVQGDDANSGEAAERGDWFGKSLAMIPYRPVRAAAGVQNSMLVIGTPGEDIGSVSDAGQIHQYLITTTHASLLAITAQSSAGISGSNEAGDYFGERVVAVNRNPSVETSPTTVLVAVGVAGQDHSAGVDSGTIRVFAGGTTAVVSDVTVDRAGAIPGSPTRAELVGAWLASDGTNLLVSVPYGNTGVYGVPWANLAAGNGASTVTYLPGQSEIPSSTTGFGLSVG